MSLPRYKSVFRGWRIRQDPVSKGFPLQIIQDNYRRNRCFDVKPPLILQSRSFKNGKNVNEVKM